MDKKLVYFSIAIAIEVIYIISCLIVIPHIYRYSKKATGQIRTFSITLLFFLITAILATILQGVNSQHKLSRIILTSNLLLELSYLFVLQKYFINNKVMNKLFISLLLFCAFYIIRLGLMNWKNETYVPLFVLETLIAGTISLTYFIELSSKITYKNVFEEPITLIMLGLFFCFGLPLSFYSCISVINYTNPNFKIETEETFKYVLAYMSRISTICYIVFNLFILKAFKCRTTQ